MSNIPNDCREGSIQNNFAGKMRMQAKRWGQKIFFALIFLPVFPAARHFPADGARTGR
jgi:hypothetical protein